MVFGEIEYFFFGFIKEEKKREFVICSKVCEVFIIFLMCVWWNCEDINYIFIVCKVGFESDF